MSWSMIAHHLPLLALSLCLSAIPALAQDASPLATPVAEDLPPGLVSARLRPGWTDAAGNRVMALDLELEPGWKTYWRSPGDTGLPPRFEWQGSRNLAGVTFHWPAPQAIRSGERMEMGYHDSLLLPFSAHPADPAKPVEVMAQVELGLCEAICVPASLDLVAPDTGSTSDPQIAAALRAEPARLDLRPPCEVRDIEDGLRVAVDLPADGATLAAVELPDQPDVWISGAELVQGQSGPQAVVEMVAPSGKPFVLDPAGLRLTVVSGEGKAAQAVEMLGCTPIG